MKVGFARNLASEWVKGYGEQMDGFIGAYFSGSTIGLLSDDELPESSDIDIVIVTSLDEPPLKLGKILYCDVLLEVTYLSYNQISSMEEVLISHHLANSLRTDTIIADTDGCMHRLQSQVSLHFAEKKWVHRRCENVQNNIKNALRNIDTSLPFYDQVTNWLFPTGVTTHVLLLAALRNPTVRCRYLAVREVLREYGYTDFYPKLLGLLGCTHLTAKRIEEHLEELDKTFDVAAAVAKTPFFFSTDITTIAKPIAIDGSLKLIRSGFHQEAVFWIVATYARCHKILAVDATIEQQSALIPAFEAIMADLGIVSSSDLLKRAEEGICFLPSLWDITEKILSQNTGIFIG